MSSFPRRRIRPAQFQVLVIVAGLTLLAVPSVRMAVSETPAAGSPENEAASSATPTTENSTAALLTFVKKPSVAPLTERERRFEKLLNGATLEGSWQVTQGGFAPSAPLSEPHVESYTIAGVEKIADDVWVVRARVQFADKDVTLPVPVRVVFAEDTAIISVHELAMPLLGDYSARVMFHEGFYSGVWYSTKKTYGGIMYGQVKKVEDEATTRQDELE